MRSHKGAVVLVFALLTIPLPGITALVVVDPTEQVAQAVVEAAANVYGHSGLTVTHASEPNFHAAFAAYDLYIVNDLRTIPPISLTMAMKGESGRAYDLTRDWRDLVKDAGYQVMNASNTLLLGRAFVSVGHAAQGADAVLVSASDSVWLNTTVTNPTVTSGVTTWTFRGWTWSSTNGRLAEWTIKTSVTEFVEAKMHVRQVGVGPAAVTLEAVLLWPDDAIRTTYSPAYSQVGQRNASTSPISLNLGMPTVLAACDVFVTTPNFDGTEWKACYLGGAAPPSTVVTVGTALVNGGVQAYGKLVESNPSCGGIRNPAPNLTFEAVNEGCVTTVGMMREYDASMGIYIPACGGTPACVEFGRIYVHPYFREFLLAVGAYTDPTVTAADLARSVIGHEYLHLLQTKIRGTYIQQFDEGQSRFIETILDPETTSDPTSLFYHYGGPVPGLSMLNQGVQQMQQVPTSDLCGATYANALLFAHAYATSGGAPSFHRELVEASPSTTECTEGLIITAMATTLAAHGGSSFAEFFDDFSLRMFTRNFTWAGVDGIERQWGEHLVPVALKADIQLGTTTSPFILRARSYSPIPETTTGTIACSGTARGVLLWEASSGEVTPRICTSSPTAVRDSSGRAIVAMAVDNSVGVEATYLDFINAEA